VKDAVAANWEIGVFAVCYYATGPEKIGTMTSSPCLLPFALESIVTLCQVEQRGSLASMFADDLYSCTAPDVIYVLEKIDPDYFIVKYVHPRYRQDGR
jgi:hypothetical protein